MAKKKKKIKYTLIRKKRQAQHLEPLKDSDDKAAVNEPGTLGRLHLKKGKKIHPAR